MHKELLWLQESDLGAAAQGPETQIHAETIGEQVHLKAARISDQGARVIHELVQPASIADDSWARMHQQVIRVAKHKLSACLNRLPLINSLQLMGKDLLKVGLGFLISLVLACAINPTVRAALFE